MNFRSYLLAPSALILACGLAAAAEPTLKPGTAIDLSAVTAAEWIKGEAPKAYEPGKIYVFECWATWCGGCIANIPHLNELHHQFHDKGLLVHGIDVWEKDKNLAVKFVQAKGDAMSYPVAYAAKGSRFEKDWLNAAGVGSIPHAFVVKDGKLILSCHPGYLTEETVTAMLTPGGCDKTVEAITRKAEAADRFVAAQHAFNDAEKKGDFAAMETAIADCDRAQPGHAVIFKLKTRLCLSRKDWPGMLKLIDSLAPGISREQQLRSLAERFANEPANSIPAEFTASFVKGYAASVKQPIIHLDPHEYAHLAVLQWRAGSHAAAAAAADNAVASARKAKRSPESIAAFEKFAAAIKSGTLPEMSELNTWGVGKH